NHGYSAAERRATRKFRVNLELTLPLKAAAASDKIADTIDYRRICDLAVEIGTTRTFRLLEALAGNNASAIPQLYPKMGIAIEVEKLAPPCRGAPEASGVRLTLPPE